MRSICRFHCRAPWSSFPPRALCLCTVGLLVLSIGAQSGVAQATHGTAASHPQQSQDRLSAIRAMHLSSTQQQALTAIRGRYAGALQVGVARLNTLSHQHAAPGAIAATQDTLHALLAAERAAVDSVVTPQQRQQFDSAMQALRLHAGVRAVRHPIPAAASPNASAVPMPTGRP